MKNDKLWGGVGGWDTRLSISLSQDESGLEWGPVESVASELEPFAMGFYVHIFVAASCYFVKRLFARHYFPNRTKSTFFQIYPPEENVNELDHQ